MSEIELRNQIWNEIAGRRAYLQKIKSIEPEIQRLSCQLNQLKVGINKLPIELLCLIFKHLNLLQLIVCETVCVKWSAVVKSLNINSLTVDEEDRAFGQNVSTGGLSYPSFRFLAAFSPETKLRSSICSSLKLLKISNYYKDPVPIDFINSLTELQDLQIECYHCKDEMLKMISLPNLKSLAITNIASRLILNTPKLTKYKSVGQYPLSRFIFPERITELFGGSFHTILEQLSNLEILSLSENDVYKLSTFDLKYMAKLKRLSVRIGDKGGIFPMMKIVLANILRQKKALKRDDLQIVFFGVILENEMQLSEGESYFRDENEDEEEEESEGDEEEGEEDKETDEKEPNDKETGQTEEESDQADEEEAGDQDNEQEKTDGEEEEEDEDESESEDKPDEDQYDKKGENAGIFKRIPINHVEIKTQEMFKRLYDDISWFLMKNYANLYEDDLQYIGCCYYSSLMRYVDKEVPPDFHEKFSCFEYVAVDDPVDDQDHLIEFVKKIQKPFGLILKSSALLNRSFYEQLSSLPITYLEIFGVDETSDLIHNMDFILDFPVLRSFLTDQEVSLDLVRRTFAKFVNFGFQFRHKGIQVSIKKFKKNPKFQLFFEDDVKKETDSSLENRELFDTLEGLLANLELKCSAQRNRN